MNRKILLKIPLNDSDYNTNQKICKTGVELHEGSGSQVREAHNV